MFECSPEKKKLVEEMGVHFEQSHSLSPLAARIYSIMILCPKDGHTFEEIVEITGASKSSVSTHLNLLLQIKNVEYFTRSGDRKRYFRASRNYLKITLEDYLTKVSEEISLLEKITAFNAAHNQKKFQEHEDIGLLFMEYLKSHEKNLEDTINKMSKISEH